jgi:bifunctional ADP-heptose synthase (sugar kinase/adenylyltransferase)
MVEIIVVGDSIKDTYFNVEKKINPENSAPVYKIKNKSWKYGGASNVVINLKALKNNVIDLTRTTKRGCYCPKPMYKTIRKIK